MKTSLELKNRKAIMLCLQFMRMVNEDCPGSVQVFCDIVLDEEGNEINFRAANSHSLLLEYSTCLCQLFNLTIHPSVDHEGGTGIKYSLLGN